MIASVRRAVADLDWEQLGMLGGAVLALLLVTAAIVSGSRTTTSAPPAVTYCAATATHAGHDPLLRHRNGWQGEHDRQDGGNND